MNISSGLASPLTCPNDKGDGFTASGAGGVGSTGWLRYIGVEWRWISSKLTNKSLLLAAQPPVSVPSCPSWIEARGGEMEPPRQDELKLLEFTRRAGALIQREPFHIDAVGHVRRVFHSNACGRVLTDRLQPSIMNEPSLLQCHHSWQALQGGAAPRSHGSAEASTCPTCKTWSHLHLFNVQISVYLPTDVWTCCQCMYTGVEQNRSQTSRLSPSDARVSSLWHCRVISLVNPPSV